MNGADIYPSHLLSQLESILNSNPHIDEVGFIHPTQFSAFNEEVHSSPSLDFGAGPHQEDEITQPKPVQTTSSDSYFWHSEHKLGISILVLLPLYTAAKDAFMDAYKRYRMLSNSHVKKDETLDNNVLMCSTSFLDIVESEVMKHSRALLLLSCDFGSAWNSRKLIVSKKQLFPMLMDELLLSTLVLSYSPKSEHAWIHRRWVIKMMTGKCANLQEIVERESELVKTLAEVLLELQGSRDWAGLHVADNSCFHYRARLLLQMIENLQHNNDPDGLSGSEFHRMWKEELDWVGMLIRRYVGREALWLHRRFLSLVWMKHLANDDQSISCHYCSRSFENCDAGMFIEDELMLVNSCTIIPDNDFGDYDAQATYAATYVMWLAKQMPMTFGVELRKNSQYEALRPLVKGCLWDTMSASCTSIQ